MYNALNGYYSLGGPGRPITDAELTQRGYTDEQIMMLRRLVRNQGYPIEYFMRRMIPAASWAPLTRNVFGWPTH